MSHEPTQVTSTVSPDGRVTVCDTPDGVAFRPAPRWSVGRAVAMLAVGVLAPLALIAVAATWRGEPAAPPFWFVVTCAAITGVGGVAASVHLWRVKATPLVAQRNGRLTYGSHVLLEPGASRRVRVERVRDPEGEDSFAVVCDNRWGPVVRVETPGLADFRTHAAARWFAARLAGVLGAEVVLAEPGGDSRV